MGGSGSSSGKGGGGNYTAHAVRLTEQDWYDWQVDAEAFQQALLEGTVPRYGAEGKQLTQQEKQRIFDVAHQLQNQGLNTLNAKVKETYRGESYASLEAAQKVFRSGSTYTTKKLTSLTTDRSTAEEYASMGSGGNVKVIQIITSVKGTRGVRVPNSSEIVAPKGISYKITGTTVDRKNNTLKVYLFRKDR